MKPILEVNGVSKKYRLISHQPYVALRDAITEFAKNPFKYLKPRQRNGELYKDEFWALKNISFTVSEGETVGIIGRNGAGKSTLLKILGRITHPTKGDVILRGRVASL